jgi:hypothetical protein
MPELGHFRSQFLIGQQQFTDQRLETLVLRLQYL